MELKFHLGRTSSWQVLRYEKEDSDPWVSLCQPLAPKLKWSLRKFRKNKKSVIFRKTEGPQTSLLETGTTVPSSKEIKLLQRQRHAEPLYLSSHRLTEGMSELKQREMVDFTCLVGFLQTHSQRTRAYRVSASFFFWLCYINHRC